MQIYWNKRKRLHNKRVQLPEDWFGTPTWPPWRHVKGFPKSVHILGMPVLYQLICMVCGREDPGVEFKVRLISRASRECTCRWCNNHCLIPFASTHNSILGDPGAASRDDRIVIGNQWYSAPPGMERLSTKNPFRRRISSVRKEGTFSALWTNISAGVTTIYSKSFHFSSISSLGASWFWKREDPRDEFANFQTNGLYKSKDT